MLNMLMFKYKLVIFIFNHNLYKHEGEINQITIKDFI